MDRDPLSSNIYERMTDPARNLLNFYRNLSLMRIPYQLVHTASHPQDDH